MILTQHIIFDNHAQRWNLYPFGDLQFGAKGFREDLFEELVERVVSDPLALTIGLGDYTDHFRPTLQHRFEGATLDDPGAMEALVDMHKTHMEKVRKKLLPIIKKGRCLGLLGGHHDFEYGNGTNSTQFLCASLGVKYLGRSCLMRLSFRSNNRNKCNGMYSVVIHAQHGTGGGGLISTDLKNLESKTAPYYDADLFLRGHSTKKGIIKTTSWGLSHSSNPRLIERDKLLVNTGGFMMGYVEGPGASYVETANMAPLSLGWVEVGIKLNENDRRGTETKNFTLTAEMH